MDKQEKEKFNKFFELWKGACDEKIESLNSTWYGKWSKYTEAILGQENSIMSLIAERSGLEYSREYYHIDAVLYKKEYMMKGDSVNGTWPTMLDVWLRKIDIALEHENNIYSAYQEICHLLTIYADLKVVVTYPGTKDLGKKRADDFHRIFQDIASKEAMLLIFGYPAENDTPINWEAYIMSSEELKLI